MTKNTKPQIIIIGAGGHGKVVCDAVLAQGDYHVAGFADSEVPVDTQVLHHHRVVERLDKLAELASHIDYFIVAIGNNETRERLYNTALQYFKPATVIHPMAAVSDSAGIGAGSVCLAGSVINAGSSIGENTIVNSGVVVDHDCVIGSHVHLSIGTLAGCHSSVAAGVTTAVGARIEPSSTIS